MFNIGPMELLVLATVGFVVLGPDKLPQLAKDAARMLRTLREMAQGAKTQLADELPEEFRNFNPANLNPRNAIRNAILGDDEDLSALNPSQMMKNVFKDEPAAPPTQQPAAQPPKPAAAGEFDAT